MTLAYSVLYVDGQPLDDRVDPARGLATAREREGLLWVGLVDSDPDETVRIAAELGLHDLGVRESLRKHQRSGFERYGDDLFLVLQPARYDDATETVQCDEVDVFVSDRLVVTVTRSDRIDLADVRARLDRHPEVLRRGVGAVLWAMLDVVTQGYRAVLDGVENDIDEIEEQLFADDPAVSRRIFDLQREVIDLAHATSPLPDVLARLHTVLSERDGSAVVPLDDLRARCQYVADRVGAMRQTLDNALTIHATLVDQRLDEKMADLTVVQVRQNEQVKKISSWAAIGFAPTLVAGIYGMNFRFMPELEQPWGYPFAIGLMVAVSVGLYVVFKRNDWL